MLRPPIREIEAFLCSIFYDLSLHVECSHARIYGCCAQLLFDAEKLIVLCDTLGSGRCAGLDLAGVQCDCQICNRCILSLAGAVGRDRSIACLMCHLDRFKCLGHGTDLVQLDQDGIATAKGDTFCKALCIRYKQIIADELYLIPSSSVSFFQPSQSSSSSASSIEMIGNFSTSFFQCAISSSEV